MPRLSSFNDGYSSEVQRQFGIDPEYLNSTMLFCQLAAPTGWVRDTTNDDCTLRITSGAGAGTGGTTGFSTALSSNRLFSGSGNINASVGPWTLTSPQVPRHTHDYSAAKERLSYPTILAPNSPSPATNKVNAFQFLNEYRPQYSNEPISGDYPTAPGDVFNSYYNPALPSSSPLFLAGHQYRPGRFNPAGGGQSHSHTTPAGTNINWIGNWNMNVKYVGAIFAKYTG
jgi:hypothetical protein